jgi:GNAT superfamily N-acetyltransferase
MYVDDQIKICDLDPADSDGLAGILSQAFLFDPIMTYAFLDDEDVRGAFIKLVYSRVIRYALLYGEVLTTESVDGGAIFLSPGNEIFSLWRAFRTGMFSLPFELGWENLRRFMATLEAAEEGHKYCMHEQHWYLWVIGVHPSKQGKGIGSALMDPILSRADVDGLPCYLETSNERNLPIYENKGFKVRFKTKTPDDGPHIWGMVREPNLVLTGDDSKKTVGPCTCFFRITSIE